LGGGYPFDEEVGIKTETDNGVGFNEKNFASFDVYGSDYKLDMGCKGVGRDIMNHCFA
jgi:hypothetical protein